MAGGRFRRKEHFLCSFESTTLNVKKPGMTDCICPQPQHWGDRDRWTPGACEQAMVNVLRQ